MTDRQTIRAATQRDADTLADVIRRCFADVAERFDLTPDNCPAHPSNCTREWVAAAMAKGVRFYLLEDAEEATGCVALEHADENVCYLERLGVLPECRGQGLGRRLVSHALGEAASLGAQRMEIGIIADHVELRQWYARRGFAVTREDVTFDHLPFKVTFMAIGLGTDGDDRGG